MKVQLSSIPIGEKFKFFDTTSSTTCIKLEDKGGLCQYKYNDRDYIFSERGDFWVYSQEPTEKVVKCVIKVTKTIKVEEVSYHVKLTQEELETLLMRV